MGKVARVLWRGCNDIDLKLLNVGLGKVACGLDL